MLWQILCTNNIFCKPAQETKKTQNQPILQQNKEVDFEIIKELMNNIINSLHYRKDIKQQTNITETLERICNSESLKNSSSECQSLFEEIRYLIFYFFQNTVILKEPIKKKVQDLCVNFFLKKNCDFAFISRAQEITKKIPKNNKAKRKIIMILSFIYNRYTKSSAENNNQNSSQEFLQNYQALCINDVDQESKRQTSKYLCTKILRKFCKIIDINNMQEIENFYQIIIKDIVEKRKRQIAWKIAKREIAETPIIPFEDIYPLSPKQQQFYPSQKLHKKNQENQENTFPTKKIKNN